MEPSLDRRQLGGLDGVDDELVERGLAVAAWDDRQLRADTGRARVRALEAGPRFGSVNCQDFRM